MKSIRGEAIEKVTGGKYTLHKMLLYISLFTKKEPV